MRVLLDECLPRGLKKHLRNHEVKTVPEAGWAGKKNGELLRVAAGDIDVFTTIDSNLVYQQKVGVLPFGVVVLAAHS
jgi:predicted nuclease of predicted toxin-antitoxin system